MWLLLTFNYWASHLLCKDQLGLHLTLPFSWHKFSLVFSNQLLHQRSAVSPSSSQSVDSFRNKTTTASSFKGM